MTEKLQQRIKEEIAKLPKEAQEAISAFDWVKQAEDIGKKYLLNEDDIHNFQLETLLILVGLEEPEAYPRNIENEVGTTKEGAENMADEVFEKIIIPITEKLQNNIKNNADFKNADWQQNLNFILSGGDYLIFITPKQSDSEDEKSDRLIGTSNTVEIKNRLLN